MSQQGLPPQKIIKHMQERGAVSSTTAEGDTIYVLGSGAVSATLTCDADKRYRLEICLHGLRKQAETPVHIAKLWAWWIAQR